jgi:hypothetical protein
MTRPARQVHTAPLLAHGGFLAAALARAEAWLLEPLDRPLDDDGPDGETPGGDPPRAEPPVEPPLRSVVAVVGLAPRCGATTVARGLGAELAARDAVGAAIVSTRRPPAAGGLRTPSAGRLARSLSALGLGPVRACGRICLLPAAAEQAAAATARRLAPIVLDVPYGWPPAPAAALADHVVLVRTPPVEPALAEVVATSLASDGAEPPLILLNRSGPGDEEGARSDVVLPEAPAGAHLALAGYQANGALGSALGALADRSEAPA